MVTSSRASVHKILVRKSESSDFGVLTLFAVLKEVILQFTLLF